MGTNKSKLSLDLPHQQRSSIWRFLGSGENICLSVGENTVLFDPQWSFEPSATRRFHDFCEDGQSGHYFLPNDTDEQDRLQVQHFILKLAYDGNILCPAADALKSGGNVLDIGCAQGVWVLECAFEFPNATFHGVDMTPIFPADIKPKNVHFHLANVLDGLPFLDDVFDLTAMRFLTFAFREKDEWPGLLAEILRVTKPGGWVQLMEPDFFMWQGGSSTNKAISMINEAMRKRGQNPHIARKLPGLLKEAGCTSIEHRFVSIPTNWPANFVLGEMAANNIVEFLRGAKDFIVKTHDETEEHWEALRRDVREECKENKSFMNIHLIIGRKPETLPQK